MYANCLNPYFIGLPILIAKATIKANEVKKRLNPYFIGLPILIVMKKLSLKELNTVSILILLDYLFL